MSIELTAILLMFLSSRWVYILARRYDKPKVTYTVIAVLIYLIGGLILAFIATFIMLMLYGEFAFHYEKLVAAFFTLLGALSVGIYYLILLRKWRKQQKNSPSNKEVLDDNLLN